MAKEDYNRLMEIANQLKKSDPPFFRDHDIYGLQAFVRDAGRCEYCASEYYLYGSYAALGLSAADHLLPKRKYEYERFRHEPRNLVACCVTCNKIKGRWDPATEAPGEHIVIETIEQLETRREELIERARKYIRENPDRCEAMFKQAKQNFEAAVADYRHSVEEPNAA